jgi:hypothetical protein
VCWVRRATHIITIVVVWFCAGSRGVSLLVLVTTAVGCRAGCLAASSCLQTRYTIAARSAAAPLCHPPSLFLLCLSEQGEPAAETHQTLHARWIPPRLTGAQGIVLAATLEERKARRTRLACTLTRHDSTLPTSLALFTTTNYRYSFTGTSNCHAWAQSGSQQH